MSLIVYSKNNCPGCETLKAKLRSAGIEYEVKNISTDAGALAWVLDQGHRSVPVVYRDGVHVAGIDSLFNKE